MSKQYTTGFRSHRCSECQVNWTGEGDVRSYDPDTGEDVLIERIEGEEHPQNGCVRAPQPATPTPV